MGMPVYGLPVYPAVVEQEFNAVFDREIEASGENVDSHESWRDVAPVICVGIHSQQRSVQLWV